MKYDPDKIYKTEEEAEKAADELNKKNKPAWFCPLINDQCNSSCICYQGFMALNDMDYARILAKWVVKRNDCGNAMFYETTIYYG